MKAIWQGIYNDIKNDILEGTYPFQSFLPSEAQLVQKYERSPCLRLEVSKHTTSPSDARSLIPKQR